MTFTDALERRLPHQLPLAKNPVLNGIADLRSAIQRASAAEADFRFVCNGPFTVSEHRFGELEDAYLDTANEVRDALGALGLVPSEINQLGEVLS